MSFWIIRVPRSSKNVCDFNVIEAYDSRELPTRLKSCPLRIGEVGMTTNAEQPPSGKRPPFEGSRFGRGITIVVGLSAARLSADAGGVTRRPCRFRATLDSRKGTASRLRELWTSRLAAT